MGCDWSKVELGRTGLSVSRLGLGSSHGLPASGVERAFERGINYFYWGSLRKSGFGEGVRRLAPKHRDDMVIVVQTYTRAASLMGASLNSALRKLGIDHADLLLLGWWNDPPPDRIIDAATALRDAGKASHVMVSCHHRPTFAQYIEDERYGAIMVRYNAAHRGAEREVFPHLGEGRPGVVAYTATRWGALLDPKLAPEGETPVRGSDCYRFALSNPNVNTCLVGAADVDQLEEAMAALDRGPMDEEELDRMRRIGDVVHGAASVGNQNPAVRMLDRFMGGGRGQPG